MDLDFGVYDYQARYYDPVIGKWNAIDLLAEKYSDLSPYNYIGNHPIRYTDPDGQEPSDVNYRGFLTWTPNTVPIDIAREYQVNRLLHPS